MGLDLGGKHLQLAVGQCFGEFRARGQRGGVIALDVGADGGGVGDRTRDVQRLILVLGRETVVAEEREHPARQPQRQRHNGDLQHQHLGGEAQIHAPQSHHEKSVRPEPEHNAQNLEIACCAGSAHKRATASATP